MQRWHVALATAASDREPEVNAAQVSHKRRKERQNVSAYAALIATPAGAIFDLPANGRISFVSVAGCPAGTLAASLTGPYRNQAGENVDRVIQTPLLLAGERVVIDRLERAVHVELGAGFDVYVDTGLSVWKKIAGNP